MILERAENDRQESSQVKISNIKSKINTYVLATLLAASALQGCDTVKREYSEPKNISGKVYNKKNVGASYLNPIDNINPMNTIDPFFDMKKGRYLTKTKEKFNVYIKTEVDSFIQDNKELYDKVDMNDKVNVTYREVYEAFYEDKDKDGKEELIQRNKLKSEILDAQAENKNE